MTLSSKATSNAIFGVVHPILDNALLARTAAEVLYWLQHAVHELEGKTAIYKTGPELADKLGISARTANSHLKRLALVGCWELAYRPKPGGISPVTWVIPNGMAWAIIDRALILSTEEKRHRKERGTDGRGHRARRSIAPENDNRMSLTLTALQKDGQTDLQRDSKRRFIRSAGEAEERMNFSDFGREEFGEEREENLREDESEKRREQEPVDIEEGQNHGETIRPPSWIKVAEPDLRFVRLMAALLEERELPPWDYTSKFTWKHAATFRARLLEEGLVHDDEQLKGTLVKLLSDWKWFVTSLASRFARHRDNELRPTPMALSGERVKICAHLKVPEKKLTCVGFFDQEFV